MFKIKLQLKYKKNIKSSCVNVNCKFPYRLTLKIKLNNLEAKLGTNKIYHENRTARWCIATSVLLKTRKQAAATSLHSGTRSRSIPCPFRSNPLIILVPFLRVVWIVEIKRTNCRKTSAFLVLYFSCHFKCSLDVVRRCSHGISLPVSC